MNSINGNTAAMKVAAEKAGLTEELNSILPSSNRSNRTKSLSASDIANITEKAMEIYDTSGSAGLEKYLNLQIAGGILTDAQAIAMYEAMEG